MLCADSLSTCEPWEAVWAPGVSVSCMATCVSALSPCTTLGVTLTPDAGTFSGDYNRLSIQDYKDGRPAYKLDGEEKYLFASGTQWIFASSLGGASVYWNDGEWGSLCSSPSIIDHDWLQELRVSVSPGRRSGWVSILRLVIQLISVWSVSEHWNNQYWSKSTFIIHFLASSL